jgi:mannose-6-phosphate isomerase
MTAERLSTIRVEKPWGRHDLWPGFVDPASSDEPVGEVWFDAPDGESPELMIKYLFTSERLSIQVHPNDEQARAAGYARGKEEAWIILAAEPDSTIGLGTVRALSGEELRLAALDGSIEDLVDWKPVKAGDVIYSPAGTVHAIGAGITLIEVQQNVDLTYRLYDYGRPRELHLDEGVAVSKAEPFQSQVSAKVLDAERTLIVGSDKFQVERWSWAAARDVTLPDQFMGWLIPVSGSGTVDGEKWQVGECWTLNGTTQIAIDAEADMLFAYPGPNVLPSLD